MYKKNVRILSTHIIAYFSQAQYVIGVRREVWVVRGMGRVCYRRQGVVRGRYGTMPWLHPKTTQACAQGWERAALIRAQNMFCCQIVRRKNCAGNDGGAKRANGSWRKSVAWKSANLEQQLNEELANLRSGYWWGSGHDSRTSEHVLNHRPRHYHPEPHSLQQFTREHSRSRVGCLAGN